MAWQEVRFSEKEWPRFVAQAAAWGYTVEGRKVVTEDLLRSVEYIFISGCPLKQAKRLKEYSRRRWL